MKKIYTLAGFVMLSAGLSAQNDTLVWEDFNGSDTWTEISPEEFETNNGNSLVWSYPFALTNDPKWYLVDLDNHTPNNTDIDMAWSLTTAFGVQDESTFDGMLMATSWFNPFAQANNWVITNSFICSDDAVLTWYSAPFQTPLFLDGYKVLVSTTDNDPASFAETLFVAKEFISIPDGQDSCVFSNYTFGPAGAGFIHGENGSGVWDNPGDCQRDTGAMVQHTVSLSQFDGQNIFIAFVHDSDDDNLIGLDNILVKGTFTPGAGIKENEMASFSAYPNPTADYVQLGYRVNSPSEVNVKVIDATGRVLQALNLGTQNGNNSTVVDMTAHAAGLYSVVLETADYRAVKQVIKK